MSYTFISIIQDEVTYMPQPEDKKVKSYKDALISSLPKSEKVNGKVELDFVLQSVEPIENDEHKIEQVEGQSAVWDVSSLLPLPSLYMKEVEVRPMPDNAIVMDLPQNFLPDDPELNKAYRVDRLNAFPLSDPGQTLREAKMDVRNALGRTINNEPVDLGVDMGSPTLAGHDSYSRALLSSLMSSKEDIIKETSAAPTYVAPSVSMRDPGLDVENNLKQDIQNDGIRAGVRK